MSSSQDLVEINENLADLEQNLLHYEKSLDNEREDAGFVHFIFRYAHNLKSSLGMLGFSNASTHLHLLESYFDDVRNGKQNGKPALVSVCVSFLDVLSTSLAEGKDLPETCEVLAPLKENQKTKKDELKEVDLSAHLDAGVLKRCLDAESRGLALYLAEKLVGTSLKKEYFDQLPLFEEITKLGEIIDVSPSWEQLPKDKAETVLRVLFGASQGVDRVTAVLRDPVRPVRVSASAGQKRQAQLPDFLVLGDGELPPVFKDLGRFVYLESGRSWGAKVLEAYSFARPRPCLVFCHRDPRKNLSLVKAFRDQERRASLGFFSRFPLLCFNRESGADLELEAFALGASLCLSASFDEAEAARSRYFLRFLRDFSR